MAFKFVFPKIFKPTKPNVLPAPRFQSTGRSGSQTTASRFEKINSRLPRFLHKYTAALKSAPVTHISAFLILHEITAVVPLFGLAATFHYAKWLPPYISEGKYISDYVEKFGRYFKKKGWLGDEGVSSRDKWWGRGENVTRIIVELATSYAIVKALMPLRLVFSVWAAPWFARTFITPVTGTIKRLVGARKPVPLSTASGTAAASTGATGAGVIGTNAKQTSTSTRS